MERLVNVAMENKSFHDVNPVQCGYESCLPGHRFGPAIRPFYLIHCVLSGKGVFEAGGSAYPLEAGQAFLIKPGEVTVYTADTAAPWAYIWIGFDGALANKLDVLPSPVFPVHSALFRDMLEAARLDAMREEYLAGKIFLLLSELFQTQKNWNYADMAANFIAAGFLQDLKIRDVAKAVGVDQRYLSRLFREKMGCSMQDYLTRQRMEEAARLLKRGFNVSETTIMCGYRDPFVFSKAFKQYYGCAPKYFLSLHP